MKPFVLRTDASDVGIRAVLLQQHEGKLFPVAYASKKLLPRERNYSIIEKECLDVVWAVKRFNVYLYGAPFVLQTDHRPLAYLNRTKFTNGRITRWALFLQPYSITSGLSSATHTTQCVHIEILINHFWTFNPQTRSLRRT